MNESLYYRIDTKSFKISEKMFQQKLNDLHNTVSARYLVLVRPI